VSIVIAGAHAYFFVTFPPTTGVAIGVAAQGVCVFVLFPSPHAASKHAPAAMPEIIHLIIESTNLRGTIAKAVVES
jgi:hypothetical protein